MAISRKTSTLFGVLVCFVCCIYGHSLREKRQTTSLPLMIDQIIDEVSANDQVDFVIVMDRSRGMGRSWFYRYEKTFAQSLIHQYVNLHPDYVRLAVITFGKDVTTPINYISSPSDDNLKVKLFFAPEPAWDDVVFYTDIDRSGATDLNLGLTRAKEILEEGQALRPNAKKIILTISDGDYDNQVGDPLIVVGELNSMSTKMYANGVGAWLKTGNIRESATNASYYAPYDDSDGESQPYNSWMDLLDHRKRAGDENTFPLYFQDAIDSSYCDPGCDTAAGFACFTDTRSGHADCVCPPGRYLNNGQCQECDVHRYKSSPGNAACHRCPSAYVIDTMGSTSMSDCTCNPAATDCDEADLLTMDGCDPNPCNTGEQCWNMLTSGTCSTEACLPGFESLDNECITNIDDCNGNQCVTYGTQCLDMVDDYLCVCPVGYFGRYCEINIENCVEGICDNNATCTDEINNFYCNCSETGYDGTYCENIITTTTTTTTLPPPTAPSAAPAAEEDNSMVVIIGAAAGGFVFIVIIIALIVSIVMYRRRKAAEKEAANVKEELNTLKRERRGRGRQTFTKSISQAFQGFWKRRTLRSSMYENHSSPAQGAPTAPPRPDLLGEAEPVNTVDEYIMDDQGIKATSGMDGWKSYLLDLQRANVINSGMIADIDGERYACTSKFTANQEEVERIDNDLHLAKNQSMMIVLNQEFLILDRTEDGTHGIATDGSSLSIMMSRTKKYLIVLIATVETEKERARLNKELHWITDHIKGEGY